MLPRGLYDGRCTLSLCHKACGWGVCPGCLCCRCVAVRWSCCLMLPPPSLLRCSTVNKAQKAKRSVRHGTHNKVVKVRTKTHFYRPKTLRLARNPKVVRKSVRKNEAGLQRLDKYSIVRFPLTTESAMKKIEDNNTLVFIVNEKANKRQIKAAVRGMYEIECAKVNTLIRFVWLQCASGSMCVPDLYVCRAGG